MTQYIGNNYVDASGELPQRRFDRLADLDDERLIALVRTGGTEAQHAFAELWKRHLPAALAAARRITTTFDSGDLASEAFARILSSLQTGRGPDLSFRAYLVVTMRNVAAGWARQSSRLATLELEDIDTLPETAAGLDRLDRLAGFEAFRSLPERWRKVLWYSEVEDMNPAELGELFGIKASAAAMLAFRARQGLRKAWQASLEADARPSAAALTADARPTAAALTADARPTAAALTADTRPTAAAVLASRAHIGSAETPNSRRRAERAAFQPDRPCTPGPGGVDDEQR